jgi:translocation and assembly module TamB
VIHGRGELEEIHPLNVNAQIEISLGDDVRYLDTNLDARLTGGLRLGYQSGRAATAIGTLEVSGQYDAYGSPLDLDGGRLIFSGPLRDPAIDIRAVRMIGDTTVGVQLSGTLLNTQTRVFSNPTMSEADALSYLLFGRPLESTGDEDASILEGAALALGLRQAIPAIERIGSTLGLDELTVRATENDTGALMAGKYLSPKLYVRYSYGLFNRIGGLLLRYDISDRLSLETQSGGEKSMDILYTVEKN